MKRFLILSLLLSAPTFTGCSDEEVAAAIGGVAIGAGAVIIGDAIHHGGHRYECEGGYRRQCTRYRDYYGYERVECRRVWDSCIRRVRPYSADFGKELNADLPVSGEIASAPLSDAPEFSGSWAETFQMSYASAETLTQAFETARGGKLNAILDLGLTEKDARLLAEYKLPTQKGIQSLAVTLNQDQKLTEQMLQGILRVAREERKSTEK